MGSIPAIGSKLCPRCLVEKLPEEFAWRNKQKETRQTYCNECRRLGDKQRYYDDPNRRAMIRAAANKKLAHHIGMIDSLKDVPCVDCGNRYDPCVMDFDHVEEDKSFNVSSGKNMSWEKLKQEIDKCEVVCSNCHRIRTRDRRLASLV